jgi:hypothetical protein
MTLFAPDKTISSGLDSVQLYDLVVRIRHDGEHNSVGMNTSKITTTAASRTSTAARMAEPVPSIDLPSNRPCRRGQFAI